MRNPTPVVGALLMVGCMFTRARGEVTVLWPPDLANSVSAAPTTRSYALFGPRNTNYNVTGPAVYYTGSDLCAEDLDATAVVGRIIVSELNQVHTPPNLAAVRFIECFT